MEDRTEEQYQELKEPLDLKRKPWLIRNGNMLLRILIAVGVVSIVVTSIVLWLSGNFQLSSVGYTGIWVLNLMSAASIAIPIPGLATTCAAAVPAVGLNPFLLGLVAGSAEAIGELTGYIAGMGGENIIKRHALYKRAKSLLERYGVIILFIGSVIPNPLFDLLGIAAGSTRVPLRKFIPPVFLGKAIKSGYIAWGCHAGVEWITRYFV